MLGEPLEVRGSDAPATRIVGEVDLQQHVQRRRVRSGTVEGVGDARPVDRVHSLSRTPDQARLVRLRLTDEVPAQLPQIGELLGLRGELLLTVLADLADSEGIRNILHHYPPKQSVLSVRSGSISF